MLELKTDYLKRHERWKSETAEDSSVSDNLKGTSGRKKSLAQMKEREKCKKTSHHRPQCAKWFLRYSISKSGI